MQRTIIIIIIVFLISVIIGALFIIVFRGSGEETAEISEEADNEKTEKEILSGETVLISRDRGETWERAKIPGTFAVREIVLSKITEGRIYVITEASGVLLKDKDSDDWKTLPLNKPKKNSLYYYLAEDNKGNIYVSAYYDNKGKVIRLNLKDKTEEEIFETPLPRYAVFGIYASQDGEILRLVSSDGGFYESVDGGYSWKVLSRFKEGLLNMAINSKTGDFWTSDSKGKILKFSVKTKNFENISGNIKNFKGANTAQNIIFDENSGFLYLASGFGVLRARLGLNNWEALSLTVPPESLPIAAVYADFYDASVIYAGTKQQFYKSDNNGVSWRTINLPITFSVSKIVADKINPDIIYIGFK